MTSDLTRVGNSVDHLGSRFVQTKLPGLDRLDTTWMDESLPLSSKPQIISKGDIHNSFVLIISWIFKVIKTMISSYFEGDAAQKKEQQAFIFHSLSQLGMISLKDVVKLKSLQDVPSELNDELERIVERINATGVLDRRAYNHARKLIRTNNVDALSKYLLTIGTLQAIHANATILDVAISPAEGIEIAKKLERSMSSQTVDTSKYFDEKYATQLENMHARMQVAAFLTTLELPEEELGHFHEVLRENNQAQFKTLFADLLQRKETESEDLLAHYYKEMRASLDTPLHENLFVHLSHVIASQKTVHEWSHEFHELKETLTHASAETLNEMQPKLQALYTNFGHMLEQESKYYGSESAFANKYGMIKKEFQELGNFIADTLPESAHAHALCGCHHHDSEAPHAPADTWMDTRTQAIRKSGSIDRGEAPLADKKRVMILTCSYGSGHRSASQAIAEYLGDKEYHTRVLDTSTEFAPETDIAQMLGKEYTSAYIANSLSAGENWGIYDFIKGMGDTTPEEREAYIADISERMKKELIKERPDVLVVAHLIGAEAYLKAAKELGIPVVVVSTDMDVKGNELPEDFEYDHMRLITPSDAEEVKASILGRVRDAQVTAAGYPLRKEFVHAPSEERIAALRDEFGMAPQEKLVTIMNGGNGAGSPWLGQMVTAMERGELEDTHVVVVCGANEALKAEYDALRAAHPRIADKIHVEGWVQAPRMSEIMHLSHLVTTKPGGGSVAEALQAKTRLMLSRSASPHFPWEVFNLNFVSGKDMGAEIISERGFIEQLKEELAKPFPEAEEQPESIDVAYKRVIDEMIRAARSDDALRVRSQSWKRDLVIPMVPDEVHERKGTMLSQIELSEIMKHMAPPLIIHSTIINSLEGRAPVAINKATGAVVQTETFDAKEMTEVMHHFVQRLKHWLILDNPDATEVDRTVTCAQELLQTVLHHNEEASPRASINKVAAELDRYIVAHKLKARGFTKTSFARHLDNETERNALLARASELFETPLAKKELEKWVLEKTHTGRKDSTESYVSPAVDAVFGFLTQPAAVDALKEMHLHRAVSAFDHTLTYDESGMFSLLVNGVRTPMNVFMHRYKKFQGRIIDKDSGTEHIYTQDGGLVPGSRDMWSGPLPVFKKETGLPQAYHSMEVMSVRSPRETHAWLRFKDTEGNIYSVGKFWGKDAEESLLQHTPGSLEVGDQHEYLGHEQYRKSTTIKLTPAEFREMLADIQEEQRKLKTEECSYNMIRENCAEFVTRMVAKTGHTSGEAVPALMPILPGVRELIRPYRTNIVAKIAIDIFWKGIFTTLYNIYNLLSGGAQQEGIENRARIQEIADNHAPFDTNRLMLFHPAVIRDWQDETSPVLESTRFSESHAHTPPAQVRRRAGTQ